MNSSYDITIPLELHDLSSFTHAKEFGRDLAKKILATCCISAYAEINRSGYDGELVRTYFTMLLELAQNQEDLEKCLTAVQTEIDNHLAVKREERARQVNKEKRKGRLNLRESHEMEDESQESDSENELLKEKNTIDEQQPEIGTETMEEAFVELDMSELTKRAELERAERLKVEEENRLRDEAQLQWQRERFEAQQAILSRQRHVTCEIPEGFQIISKSKQKGKSKR